MTPHAHPRPFTGRRLAVLLCAMFAVVMAVNFTMATLASKTFSGAVVKNGYVANQDFNRWVEHGRRQAAIGWTARAEVGQGALRLTAQNREGLPLAGAKARVHLIHPFRASEARWVDLVETAPGHYAAAAAQISRGQWEANIQLERGGQTVLLRQRLFVREGQAS